jgi:hypothetical protein
MSLIAAFCTKSGVLGAPQLANAIDANAAIKKVRIVASTVSFNCNERKLGEVPIPLVHLR